MNKRQNHQLFVITYINDDYFGYVNFYKDTDLHIPARSTSLEVTAGMSAHVTIFTLDSKLISSLSSCGGKFQYGLRSTEQASIYFLSQGRSQES